MKRLNVEEGYFNCACTCDVRTKMHNRDVEEHKKITFVAVIFINLQDKIRRSQGKIFEIDMLQAITMSRRCLNNKLWRDL